MHGSWEERTFNAGGSVNGRAGNGSIELSFSGNVSGHMSMTYGGSHQRVTINTQGSTLSSVVLSLTRG